jgi:hypothetical protein
MKTATKLILSLALSVTATLNTYAATVACGGTVAKLAYHQPGRLMLQLSSMNVPVFICSPDSEWIVPGSLAGNTSAATCKTLYATLLSAKLTGATINAMHLDGDQVPASCNSFTNWTNVNVRYFEH